ncbi:MAG: pantoate--beta-alanine ligase [Saprospiraceae bacterium]|nr:pantoate--beta-alanine ligase [Saprospiraceae bacterium]
MLIFKKVADLQAFISQKKANGASIGFIPTMGALHSGHVSLVEKALEEEQLTVVSIFVNPTQFNDPEDLKKYPRPFSKDAQKLIKAGTSVLFHPDVEEVYPPGLETQVNLDFGRLTRVMEGNFRPGHFEGMANVVSRLLDIVRPDSLFMGQKDFQQLTIVKDMIRQQGRRIRLVACPIIREKNGLARSSRNERLSEEAREKASIINKTLEWTSENHLQTPINELQREALEKMEVGPFKPEYFSIVDGYTLEEVQDPQKHETIVACTAVWVEDVRLIDNRILKGKEILRGKIQENLQSVES